MINMCFFSTKQQLLGEMCLNQILQIFKFIKIEISIFIDVCNLLLS